MKKDDQEISLDTRPSDALGIAVRARCPIFISEAVVDEAGIPISSITDQAEKTEESVTDKSERERLEEDLRFAVEKENYEEAARIRDRIRELDSAEEH
jgi:bifunctional DNase/RNase